MREVFEYLVVLNKINNIYLKSSLDYDIFDLIEKYTYLKDNQKINLKDLEDECKKEWKKLFLSMNKILIDEITKQKYKGIFGKEIKSLTKLLLRIENTDLKIDELEKLFDNDFENIKLSVEKELGLNYQNKKDFRKNIIINIIVAFVFGFLFFILGLLINL